MFRAGSVIGCFNSGWLAHFFSCEWSLPEDTTHVAVHAQAVRALAEGGFIAGGRCTIDGHRSIIDLQRDGTFVVQCETGKLGNLAMQIDFPPTRALADYGFSTDRREIVWRINKVVLTKEGGSTLSIPQADVIKALEEAITSPEGQISAGTLSAGVHDDGKAGDGKS